ncbi:amidohydrolase family protein [Amnibacterium endophyticum]|uniref:Amidohydrolase family protein n=1 Tax=Amnibacterium endophyticum TaxID=2109337 RepID=A0ABW4LHI1_9MICO
MQGVTVYSADLVVPMTAPPIADGAVAVEGGRILHVGTRAWVLEHLRGRDVDERHLAGALLPGLVNAHTHLQYTRMGEVGEGRYRGFDDWAAAFTRVYERGQDWGAAAAEGARRSIAHGVTAAADIVTDPPAAPALADAGLRGIAFWEVMNWSNAAWAAGGRERVIAELERLPTTPGSGLSPHAPYSLDAEPLLDIPDIVRAHGGRLHIHLGESHFEGERPGPDGESPDWHFAGVPSFRALREAGYGASATAFVDRLGVLGPDCHVAHGVYMTAADRALLRARGTSVALCPRSNEVIGLEAPPVAAYLTEGSPIAVGTDSSASSPSLDPMADVAELVRIARRQGYGERDLHARLLAAATFGGAVAMGLDTGPARFGYLAVGALADLAGFPMAVGAEADALAELAEAAPEARATVIGGEPRSGADLWVA